MNLTGLPAPDEELATTAVSVGELVHGATKSQRAADNLARMDVLLAALTILPYDEWSGRRIGQLMAQFEQKRGFTPAKEGECTSLPGVIASIATPQPVLFSALMT